MESSSNDSAKASGSVIERLKELQIPASKGAGVRIRFAKQIAEMRPRVVPPKQTMTDEEVEEHRQREIERNRIEDEQRRHDSALHQIEMAGIPHRHSEDVDNKRDEWGSLLSRILDDLEEERGMTGLLCGPWGTGKTQMAAEIIRSLCTLNAHEGRIYEARYFTGASLIHELCAMSFDASSSFASRLIKEIDLLVIDEVEKRHDSKTGFAFNTLEQIIRERSAWLNSTLILTNLNPKKQREKVMGTLGRSICERISDKYVYVFDWGSFRPSSIATMNEGSE